MAEVANGARREVASRADRALQQRGWTGVRLRLRLRVRVRVRVRVRLRLRVRVRVRVRVRRRVYPLTCSDGA